MDLANNMFLVMERSETPTIRVRVNPLHIQQFHATAAGARDAKLVVEVMLGEKSHSTEKEKYKIFQGSLGGRTRKQLKKGDTVEFSHLRPNFPTTPDRIARIIIVVYWVREGGRGEFMEMLLSRELFVMEESKLIAIDTP